jgi:stage III sporulation protein AD
MEIVQYISLAFVALLLIVFLKQLKHPIYGVIISVIVGIILFVAVFGKIKYVFDVISQIAVQAKINALYFSTIIKIIGVAYLAEFGSQVCKDAGESSLGTRIEFAAKIIVLVLAMPIIVGVLETILGLIP